MILFTSKAYWRTVLIRTAASIFCLCACRSLLDTMNAMTGLFMSESESTRGASKADNDAPADQSPQPIRRRSAALGCANREDPAPGKK